jgi:hypothetical protein
MYYYKINYIAGALITLVITLFLGSLIFVKGRGGNIVRSYFLLMLSIAAFSFGMLLFSVFNDSRHALLLARFCHLGVSFIPVFYFHFIVKLMRLADKQRQVTVLGYILAGCFVLLNFTPYFVKGVSFKLGMNIANPGIFYPFFIFYFLAYPAYAHYLIYKTFDRLSDIGKKQIKHVTIAGICGLSGGSLIFFSVYGINIPLLGPMAFYFVAGANLFVAIATYTARLMGFEVVKRRTLIFSGLYGVVVGSFVASVFILQRFLSVTFDLNRWAVPVAALFILTIFIRPLEQFLANATDKFLYQRGYDYMPALKNIAKGMTLISDTKKLLKLMARFLSKEVRVTGCSVYIFNETANSYLREVYRGFKDHEISDKIDAEAPLVKWLIEKKEPISYESIIGWIQGERVFPQKLMIKRILDQIRVSMEKMGAALCVPSFLRGEMIGFLALGAKLSGNIYTRDDFSFLATLANSAAVAFENARMYEELDERIKKLETLYKEEHTLFLDAASAFSYAIDSKDGYTHAHALKSSGYAIATTKQLEKLLPYINFSESFYETLRIASLLHDVGKIGIPDKILKKQTKKLTPDENEKLKEHVIIGQKILKPIREIEDSFNIIRHHHENFDGTGYPDGLKGNEIPMASRIIAVCNAYDMMTCGRSHKKPMQKETALKELESKKGSQFDPIIVDAFIRAAALEIASC